MSRSQMASFINRARHPTPTDTVALGALPLRVVWVNAAQEIADFRVVTSGQYRITDPVWSPAPAE